MCEESLGGLVIKLNPLEVKNSLPHRYPMLMLDQVEELGETSAVGWKNVTVNEPCFQGHFPGAPVMPGVLVMESLCQLTWLWAERPVRMTGIKKLRFRRPTTPGDRLRLEIAMVEQCEEKLVVKATASVEGQAAVTGQLSFAYE